MVRRAALVVMAVAALGCPTREPPGGDDDSSDPPDGAPGEVDARGGGGEVACTADMPTFPTFPKECMDPGECVVALHQTDCCGTLAAIGIHQRAQDDFDAAEATCRAQYPDCECAPGPTTTEDGGSTERTDLIQVTCRNGECTTFVP